MRTGVVRRAIAVALFAAAANVCAVQAQSFEQSLQWCHGKGQPTADQTIAGCSTVITSGRLSGKDLNVAYINRGIAYHTKREYDRAIQDYDEAIRLDPEYALAFADRGSTYRLKGRYDRALQDYDEAIRLNPSNALWLGTRGFTYLKLKRYDQAIADYDAALKIDPKRAFTLFSRGVAKRARGDTTGGDADIAAAKAIDANIAAEAAKFDIVP